MTGAVGVGSPYQIFKPILLLLWCTWEGHCYVFRKIFFVTSLCKKFVFLQKPLPSFLSQFLTVSLKILCPTASCVTHESHSKKQFSGIELVFFSINYPWLDLIISLISKLNNIYPLVLDWLVTCRRDFMLFFMHL